MAKFTVNDTEITVVKIKDEDYLCLTDMLKAKDGDFFIGYLNEFPDYETQGYSLDELKTNLKSLFEDIKSEEIPYIRQTTS